MFLIWAYRFPLVIEDPSTPLLKEAFKLQFYKPFFESFFVFPLLRSALSIHPTNPRRRFQTIFWDISCNKPKEGSQTDRIAPMSLEKKLLAPQK